MFQPRFVASIHNLVGFHLTALFPFRFGHCISICQSWGKPVGNRLARHQFLPY